MRADARCRRCGQLWTEHVAAFDEVPAGFVEADFGPDGWQGLYCLEAPREPVQ